MAVSKRFFHCGRPVYVATDICRTVRTDTNVTAIDAVVCCVGPTFKEGGIDQNRFDGGARLSNCLECSVEIRFFIVFSGK